MIFSRTTEGRLRRVRGTTGVYLTHRRWASVTAFAIFGTVLALIGTVLAGSALAGSLAPAATAAAAVAAAPNDPYAPPSETIATPSTDDCAQREKPPPAVDTSEDAPPGAATPAPLPVPDRPVGGTRMGDCGLVLPRGAPPLPSDISAGAWVIADLDTGDVLAAKDPHGRYRPASTLKLLTAQVMLTNLTNLKRVVQGTQADSSQDGTRVGIEAGGRYTVRQLLSYLVMMSGNDAANALARTNVGYAKTISDMNATAKALGALDTRAATPSGLDGPGQSTSAYDLAMFAKADMATPPFPELISARDVRVPGAGNAGYVAANDNQLLYQYKGALGGKTGFTDDAGNTYVGMADRGGRRLVVTMMNGNQQPRRQWMQGASLLDWGFALPPATPPVGRLVTSLAEATAAPASPTPSTGPSSGSAGAVAVARAGSSDVAAAAGSAPPTSRGLPTAVVVLAAIGVMILALGGVLLARRRHLNRRAMDAGEAGPSEPPPGAPGPAPAAKEPAPTQLAPAAGPTTDQPNAEPTTQVTPATQVTPTTASDPTPAVAAPDSPTPGTPTAASDPTPNSPTPNGETKPPA